MSDKTKVIKLKDVKTDNKLWFEDDLSINLSSELDKTIGLKDQNSSKISLVQNANSNFFRPENNSLDIKKQDIQNTKFESIDIINKQKDSIKSGIRKEIIQLRKLSYEQEQIEKEKLLEKLNVNLDNNFKNYNLASQTSQVDKSINTDFKESKKSLFVKKNAKQNTIDLNQEQLLESFENKSKKEIKKELKKEAKIAQNSNNIKNAFKNTIKPENIQQTFEVLNLKNDSTNQSIKNELTKKHVDNKKQLFNEQLKNKIAVLEEQNNDNFSDLHKFSNKVIKEEINDKHLEEYFATNNNRIPVVNQFDFTMSNTIDDLDKAINNIESSQKKIKENFFEESTSDTTQFLENLVNRANQSKSKSLNIPKFDDFEQWFNNSKDIKALKKLAKKENKKLAKHKK